MVLSIRLQHIEGFKDVYSFSTLWAVEDLKTVNNNVSSARKLYNMFESTEREVMITLNNDLLCFTQVKCSNFASCTNFDKIKASFCSVVEDINLQKLYIEGIEEIF